MACSKYRNKHVNFALILRLPLITREYALHFGTPGKNHFACQVSFITWAYSIHSSAHIMSNFKKIKLRQNLSTNLVRLCGVNHVGVTREILLLLCPEFYCSISFPNQTLMIWIYYLCELTNPNCSYQGRIQDLIRGGALDRDRPKTAILGPQFCRILVLGPHFWWSGGGARAPPGSAPAYCI